MRKILTVFLAFVLVAFIIGTTSHHAVAKKGGCTTIKNGVLTYSAGHYLVLTGQPLLMPGFNPYGYNYQARLFNGYYANVYLGSDGFPPYEADDVAYFQRLADEGYIQDKFGKYACEYKWYWPYRDVILNMKWNDAWLSNKDCDGNGNLDRYYGYDSYIGSGAWETNHQSGTYDNDGKECHWTYFVKIVAAPSDAEKEQKQVGTDDEGIPIYEWFWYDADGTEIGPVIWGAFAVIQRVYNDPCEGSHGIEYLSPAGPGVGKW